HSLMSLNQMAKTAQIHKKKPLKIFRGFLKY
ncbi:MAG: hypothetical protein ACI837_002546, partial [Crocinitomicaceae bacterium]